MLSTSILDTQGQGRPLLEGGLIGPWAAETEPDQTRPGRTEMSNERVRTAVRVPPQDGEEPVSIVEPDRAPIEAAPETRHRPLTRGGGGR